MYTKWQTKPCKKYIFMLTRIMESTIITLKKKAVFLLKTGTSIQYPFSMFTRPVYRIALHQKSYIIITLIL